MARIEPIELTINKGGSISKVIVTYSISFNGLDLNNNIEYRERVRLRGADGGLRGRDNNLITLREEVIQPNGVATQVRDFETDVANSVLNEDRGVDDIYARVRLQDVDEQFQARERDSNQVHDRF